ncbi:CoA-binding protein [Microbacterium kunmingense]|uniref:CoA-binding protein n=1 Tax=Microbacterium kunmingense TaxID=2915939 RepID=UPI0020041CEB|nr:CoA-binding protein [Microbacterium kunmingense]
MTDLSCALPTAGDAVAPVDPPVTADGAACALPSAPAPGRTWQGPGPQERFEILRRTRSIAIVGASDNPTRASYFVATYLLGSAPYDVYFVNPRADTILGRPAYASLADLPVAPDLVDVFRRHDDLPGVAAEAVAAGAKTLWLQLGSWHEGAAAVAEGAGLSVVMDRCVKIEHARFHGGLHLAGFDTGVISSRRQLLSRRADL